MPQTITCFHSSQNIVTQELFKQWMSELASAVKGKMESDLESFKQTYEGVDDPVAPIQPEIFASGSIINTFSPTNRRETELILHAIKLFDVKVVLVIDYEKLEKDIQSFLQQNQLTDIKVIKVPKSPGISSQPHMSAE